MNKKFSPSFNNFQEDPSISQKINQDNSENKNSHSSNLFKSMDKKVYNKNKKPTMLKEIGKEKEIICPLCLKRFRRNLADKDIISIKQNEKCENCKEIFSFINCAYCDREIYSSYDYKIGINMKCPYIDCNKDFTYTLCGCCNRYIVIKDKYIEGNPITCPYDDCKYRTSTILCPYLECGFPNTFEENQYFEGSVVKCVNPKCRKNFSKFNCITCFKRFFLDDKNSKNYCEGVKIKCPYHECGKIFNKFHCPICSRINIIDNVLYKNMCKNKYNFIQCAYQDCMKTFSKITCPKCMFINHFVGKNNLEGKNIKCDNQECDFLFNFIYCKECEGLNIWESKAILNN